MPHPSILRAGAPYEINIALLINTKIPLGMDPHDISYALQEQINLDFAPAWGVSAKLKTLDHVPHGWWALAYVDHDTTPDALGYHDLTDQGMPIGHVMVDVAHQNGIPVSSVASHELVELLVDPAINLCSSAPAGAPYDFVAYEVADPVQNNSYVRGKRVPLSDFVYPAWFEEFRKPGSTRFSHMNSIDAPFKLAPGGYISVFRNGQGWTQEFGSKAAEAAFNLANKTRAPRRIRGGLNH